MRNITIGIDLAKSVFSTCTVDATGRVLQRQDLRLDGGAAVWPLVDEVGLPFGQDLGEVATHDGSSVTAEHTRLRPPCLAR